jgi:hypothetical protein
MGWIISFPNSGNYRKKYNDYSVFLSDLRKGSSNKRVYLLDIVENLEFQERFPHTVGFFKSKTGESINQELSYLEIRKIRSVEEFWKFLNDLDL